MTTIEMFMRTSWLTLQDPKQGRRHSTWWSLHSSSSRSDLDQPYKLSPKKINGIICPPKISHMCVFCKLCTYLCLLVHVNNVVEGKLKAHLKTWWTLQMATFSVLLFYEYYFHVAHFVCCHFAIISLPVGFDILISEYTLPLTWTTSCGFAVGSTL